MLIKRALAGKFAHYLELFPVVAIIGPRQAGKTTFARMELPDWNYFDLEKISDFNRIETDIEFFLKEYGKMCIIDEAQALTKLFPPLRSHIDEHREVKGRIVLLGSVNPILVKDISESLAGRIGFVEITPFIYNEITQYISINVENFWLLGGYPEHLSLSNGDHFLWIEQYIKTFVERDIFKFLQTSISPQKQAQLLRMIAHMHGKLWNSSQIASAFGVSYHTINNYMDLLENFFLIRRLPPYYQENIKKRLVKRTKLFYRDTGILHYLLDIFSLENLRVSPYRGLSFEGFVIEHLIQYYQLISNGLCHFYFYRTSQGDEIDLLVKKESTLIAYEIKTSSSLDKREVTGFLRCLDQLDISKGNVVYFGDEDYQLTSRVKVQSIHSLLNQKII
jgi:predicted AAA+ superfamily ATPase